MSLKEQIILNKLPKHIAVIMDGNGRWAKQNGKPRVFGHQNGVKAVRETTEACAELGVSYLTLYAFSTENWSRPKLEVSALMELLVRTLRKETKTLMENDVKLNAIGNMASLPEKCYKELKEAIEITKNNQRMTLTLALSYSAKVEIKEAVKNIAAKVNLGELNINDIDESLIDQFLYTAGLPDPELLIRTSNERRVSNFLLWQIAYAELYFTKTHWPDFHREELYKAIIDFQQRERRFGKISEQLEAK